MLKKIDLSNITFKRPNECSTIEIFYAMFIRALMTKKNNIIIVTPYAMIHNLKDLNPIFDNIRLLNKTKNIIILDILTNEAHYTELGCDIEK